MSFIRPVALNKSRESSGMARRLLRRRSIVIGAVIVVLSIGIVFASLPYLQPPTTAHGSITGTLSHVIGPADSTHVGFYGLKLPNITATESFFVGVSVANGAARCCVIGYQQYENWAFTYNTPHSYPFPSGSCIFRPPQATSH